MAVCGGSSLPVAVACGSTPITLQACADQIEILNDERRVTDDERVPVLNRTISPVAWCAAPHLPWPAPLWTRVGKRRVCKRVGGANASVGHSPRLLAHIERLHRLVELTNYHRRLPKRPLMQASLGASSGGGGAGNIMTTSPSTHIAMALPPPDTSPLAGSFASSVQVTAWLPPLCSQLIAMHGEGQRHAW